MNQIELLDMMNMASPEELMTLPGIGPVIAGSIISYRPYDTLPDTYQVTGINANFIERLLQLESDVPSVVKREPISDEVAFTDEVKNETLEEGGIPTGLIEPLEEPILLGSSPTMSPDRMLEPPVDDLAFSPVALDESLDQEPILSQVSEVDTSAGKTDKFMDEINTSDKNDVVNSIEDSRNLPNNEPKAAVSATPPETTTKDKFEAETNHESKPQKQSKIPFWKFLLGAVITALVTILLTLAIMNSLNGSLKYATAAQFRTSQREATQLNEQFVTLQQDLDSLRSRVDILNGLNDRTVTLEKSQKELSDSLGGVNQELSDLQDRITNLDNQLSLQEERTGKFEKFLQDLQALLGSLYAPEGASK